MNPPISVNEKESLNREEQVVLSILEEIEKNPKTSQRNIANQLGIAVGLANSFVKRVISKGFVKIKRINSRNIHYLLTPKGVYEKSRLTYRFLRHSFRYLAMYRQKTYEILAPYSEQGIKDVVIFGSGEEAELSYLVIRELGMTLKGIVDPDHAGEKSIGYEIYDLNWLFDQEALGILLVLHSALLNDSFESHKDDILSRLDGAPILHIEI
ncbi:MAG: winged helix-turn-helix transcriptional regulator [Candidatus Omnitrophica bacterium]|nr:winged helix-turn-helix transcriptional regulator [Candidatus Omnitrophota bacterium]